jgi:hypothetical protein
LCEMNEKGRLCKFSVDSSKRENIVHDLRKLATTSAISACQPFDEAPTL